MHREDVWVIWGGWLAGWLHKLLIYPAAAWANCIGVLRPTSIYRELRPFWW